MPRVTLWFKDLKTKRIVIIFLSPKWELSSILTLLPALSSGQCGIGNHEGKDEKVEQNASNHLSSQDMYSDQRLSVSDPTT